MKKMPLLLAVLCIVSVAQSQSWNLTGNGGTGPNNFLGTTDVVPLAIRVANIKAGFLDSSTGNTTFGFRNLDAISTGTYNSAFGYKALVSNSTGIQNTALGFNAMFNNTSGSYNTIIGVQSSLNNATGQYNTAVGAYSLNRNVSAFGNTAIGMSALYWNTAGYNTAVGFESLNQNTTGYSNTSLGAYSARSNTTGIQNTAVGNYALYSSTTGSQNTATGYQSLYYNTSGSGNTGHGYLSLYRNTTGGNNTATGFWALTNSTTGNANTAMGNAALNGNVSGSYNTAVGFNSLVSNNGSIAHYNTAVGSFALARTTNSQYNTAIGYNAGDSYDNGYNNVFVGANTDVNGAGYYNVIAIGQGTVVTGSSVARFGNSATVSYGGWANWTNVSDGRLKKDVKENVSGLSFIMKLRPVTYHLAVTEFSKMKKENQGNEWDAKMQIALKEKEQVVYSGFIAQEVEKAAQELGYDFSGVDKPKNEGDLYGLRYAEFVVPLVKAMQEQQQLIEQLQKKIADLETKLNGSSISGNTSDVLSVWPNPSYDRFVINIGSTVESQAVVRVFDSKGALVKEQKMAVTPGNNQIQVDTKAWASGMYLFSAEWNQGKAKKTMRVIKQ